MKLRPLLDKVVVKSAEMAETTVGGILLPGSAKEKPQIFEVVAVGPGGIVNGEKVEMTVSLGDKVVLAKYAGAEIKLDGVEYNIISLSDILAVVE